MQAYKIICLMSMLFCSGIVNAQNFISKATIEYEVITNIKKTMGNSNWEEMIKDKMPTFKKAYYHYTFANNKSVYKLSRWDETVKIPQYLKNPDEENNWFMDFDANKMIKQKNVVGANFNVEDSIPKIDWKLSNESRIIAGFNCRKATGIIMDSVYVFAFYSEEIMIPGGPCSVSGLPGAILGLTIPRLYTSWIATKVMVNDVKEAGIKPITAKKYYTNKQLNAFMTERSKEWWGNSDDDPDAKKGIEQFRWNALL